MGSSSDGESRKRKLPLDSVPGPAWGAQSFSAVKNQAINKIIKEKGKDPGFEDFGRYFSEKQRKLRDQYHEDAFLPIMRGAPVSGVTSQIDHNIDTELPENVNSDKVNKQLFKGVSIFVDGFTTPTHQELRLLMIKYGGIFNNYFSRQMVTHIICSTLPDSKIMNPRLMSRGVPIVKPEWIVDSLEGNKLLSWDRYQLDRVAYSHPHQKTLAMSFSARKSMDSFSLMEQASEMKTSTPKNVEVEISPDTNTSMKLDDSSVSNSLGLEGVSIVEEIAKVHDIPLLLAHDPERKSSFVLELHEGTSSEVIHGVEMTENTGLGKETKHKVVDRRGHSTLNDPDFVQNYFKYSRLHFIGTWRNRYQSLVNAGSFASPKQLANSEFTMVKLRGKPTIIHLDMDCFFVSVVIRNRPDLMGKPVAVCHSDSSSGTGEISSANYPARSYGIKAGMFVRDAKTRCPQLAIVPYDFAAYEQVADKVYSILHHHCTTVQAVSCDEAFLDVTGHPDPVNLSSRIRKEIFESTQCTASAGIAENPLLARLATKKAKPNGQYSIQPHEVKKFMAVLPVEELPGVGWTLRQKLHAKKLYTCADLQSISKEVLQKDCGTKTGAMLWSYAQGIDNREVQPTQERKSIGAEVNWGVRFSCMDDAQQFLVKLSNEVAERLQSASFCGRTVTLKVKRRKEGSGEPAKFMGCGICDNLSRSETIGNVTNSAELLLQISRRLFASLHLDIQEVRGVGLQVSGLEPTNPGVQKQLHGLDTWLAPPCKAVTSKRVVNHVTGITQSVDGAEREENCIQNAIEPCAPSNGVVYTERCQDVQLGLGKSDAQLSAISDNQKPVHVQVQGSSKSQRKEKKSSFELPSLSQLDHSVLEFLPVDIVAEINNAKAQDALRQCTGRKPTLQPRATSGANRPNGAQFRRNKTKPKSQNCSLELPPLSQLDPSVLKSLPADILAEITNGYQQELPGGFLSLNPQSNIEAVSSEQTPVAEENSTNTDPPGKTCQSSEKICNFCSIVDGCQHGVCPGLTASMKGTEYEDFCASLQLQIANLGRMQSLSSILLSLGCCLPKHDDQDKSGSEEFIQKFVKLFTAHIQAIAAQDLEDVHLVLLYMKRLGRKSDLWNAVQEHVMTAAKDIIGELYGGQLTL